MNVFSGKNALKDFYDPDKCPPLPLVELPSHPFEADGVEIYAKMLTMLPAANVKSLPAANMLLKAVESGEISDDTKRIVEWSSGNTVISLAILSRIHGLAREEGVSAYISNKNPESKMQLLRFFDLELTLFGGPTQVTSVDVDGGIQAAINDGKRPGYYNPSQYTSARNPEAHIRWTGPQLLKQLPDVSVFASGLGTAGTITGVGTYLRSMKPDIVNVGVFIAPGDKVPGPRPMDLMSLPAEMDLPWKDVIDTAEFATSFDSYRTSLDLCRQGLLVGPSSGLALVGLYHYLEKVKANGELEKLRGPDGKVKCAFICCDQPFQYISEYFDKLPDSFFPRIHNQELLEVDQYAYNTLWSISEEKALTKVKAEDAIILDLRDTCDFDSVRVSGSLNLSLGCREEPNPFKSPPVLHRQWLALDKRLRADDAEFGRRLFTSDRPIIINSYDGRTALVASSILRKRGAEAYAVVDGINLCPESGFLLDYGTPFSKFLIQVNRIDLESGKTSVFEYERRAM
ncbi:Cysteine synthase B [Mycena indigotica]|uniref:Cysteine synthase B n=1 Tax=Mycena indigotica TaxID=2126181 RepID=A0A8H6VV30_9AGAR|nr:Cysteine synthase B [Mycena indigotica]KAF7289344.1 Cysteine synthase B [Mycena indigotica]